MKKTVSFEKELDFPSMIGEITSISLDHNIEFTDSSSLSGEFIVSGTYKMTEASTIEEKFNYPIPAFITLTEKLDLESAKVSINDFSYEIVNEDILKCNIDVLIEGVEEIELEKESEEIEILEEKDNDVRECDGDMKKEKEEKQEINMPTAELPNNIEEIEIKKEEEEVEVKVEEVEEASHNISSLFQVFENSEETFTTYSVYIVRKEDTLDKILDQYKITKEELSDYNDLNNIEIGSKLIIPTAHD